MVILDVVTDLVAIVYSSFFNLTIYVPAIHTVCFESLATMKEITPWSKYWGLGCISLHSSQ
jgi:hypothetical protein